MTHQNNDLEAYDPQVNQIVAYVHYGEYDYDYRFPTLVLQQRGNSIGFKLNPEDISDLERTCICFARGETECVCGYNWRNCDE